jgi:hypothetical protein
MFMNPSEGQEGSSSIHSIPANAPKALAALVSSCAVSLLSYLGFSTGGELALRKISKP